MCSCVCFDIWWFSRESDWICLFRVSECLCAWGTFTIRWIKKNSDCYFLPHSAIYLNCYSLYFRDFGAVGLVRSLNHILARYAEELLKMEFPSFRLCVATGDTLLRLLFCAICAIQLLCTHHLLHQVCVMIKPFYYKFVFRTAVWILDLNICFAFYSFFFLLLLFSLLLRVSHKRWKPILFGSFFFFLLFRFVYDLIDTTFDDDNLCLDFAIN